MYIKVKNNDYLRRATGFVFSERHTKTLDSDKNNKNSSSLIGGKSDLQYYHSIFAIFLQLL